MTDFFIFFYFFRLRQLESEGKLRPMYPPVSLSSALKIAAAARRLRSSSSTHGRPAAPTRAKSALPRVNLPDQGHSFNPQPGLLKRSNSVTGVFIDVPSPRGDARPGSAAVSVGRSTPTPGLAVNGGERSKDGNAATATMNSLFTDSKHGSGCRLQAGAGAAVGRPGSSGLRASSSQLQQNGFSSSSMDSHQSKRSGSQQHHGVAAVSVECQRLKRPESHSSVTEHCQADPTRPMRNSASTSHSRAHASHCHAPFSSHVATEKEAREREEKGVGSERLGHVVTTPRPPYGSREKNSSFVGINDDTVDDLGEDLFAERRAELLEEEQYRAAAIAKRKDRFLKDIDLYLREHPPLRVEPVTSKASAQDEAAAAATAASGGEGVHGELFRRRRVEFESSPTYLPESDYRDRLMGLWRDMNKCRYLRVPDEMIDLSGINTLATDTMKLLQAIKHRDMQPLSNAWVE